MAPKYIKWDITGRCNLRCSHCSVGKNYFQRGIHEISIAQKLLIVDKLADAGIEGISLLGGEPLFLKEDVFSVIEHAISKGIRMSLVTNGTLLSGKLMTRLARSGIDTIVVSLDGATKETHEFVRGKNTFGKVVQNIRNLTSYREINEIPLQIKINTVLNKENYPELDKMIDLCLELRVNEWTLLSLGGIGFAEDNLSDLAITPEEEIESAKKIAQRYFSDEVMNKLTISPLFVYPLIWDYIEKKYGLIMPKSRICCNASINLGYIGPDGNLYPCDRIPGENFVGYDIKDATIKPMNLIDHSFYEIWNSDYYLNMFEFIMNDDTYKDYTPCNHCKYLVTRECNPCPLYSLNSKVLIKTCKFVENTLGDISGSDKIKSFTTEILNSRFLSHKEEQVSEDLLNSFFHKIPEKKWGVRSFEKGDFIFLLDPYRVEIVGLNLMGKAIWGLIDNKRTIQEIASEVNEVAITINKNFQTNVKDDELRSSLNKNIYSFFTEISNMELINLSQKSLKIKPLV